MEAIEKVEPKSALSLYAKEQIETMKQTVARGASDTQLALFLEVCAARKLNPFAKHLYWTSNGIFSGIDGLRAIADRTGRYAPGPTRYEVGPNGVLVAAFVTVKKKVGNKWFSVEESAYMSEFAQGTPNWKTKPRVMLAKCSEARALRRCFPEDLGGIYEPAEADEPVDVTPAVAPPTARKVEATPEPIAATTVVPPEQRKAPATVDTTARETTTGDDVAKARALLAKNEAARDILAKIDAAVDRGELANTTPAMRAAHTEKKISTDEGRALVVVRDAKLAAFDMAGV